MSSSWKTGAIAQRLIGMKNSCGCAYHQFKPRITLRIQGMEMFELAKISNRSNSLTRLVIVLLEWSLVAIITLNNASYSVLADPPDDQQTERSLR
jgi:hypothetical protein